MRAKWAAEQYLQSEEKIAAIQDAWDWEKLTNAQLISQNLAAEKVIQHYAKHGGDYDCTSKIAQDFLNNK